MMNPFVLLILDGLGLNPKQEGNAVFHASTPNLDRLLNDCPNSTLITHGERVGLPEGQMGNSEVGHLNIGAGRVVYQDLSRINASIKKKEILEGRVAESLISSAKEHSLHLIGLCSGGGVHSDAEHLVSLVETAAEKGVSKIFVHAISDGRDCPPNLAIRELVEIQKSLKEISERFQVEARIVDIIGRYHAMDRDNRWERTEKAWLLFTNGIGEQQATIEDALAKQYEAGIGDEFLEPICLPFHVAIEPESSVLFFNFRADRMRQLVTSFFAPVKQEFTGFKRPEFQAPKFICSLTEYDQDFQIPVVFPPEPIVNHLGVALEKAGVSQLRLAETEKYPHVTYFFSGGVEDQLKGEERRVVPSPRDVPTYDLKPEMSVEEVTDFLISTLRAGETKVAIVNFANCDMVGHTGSFEAAKQAVEAVDKCLGRLLDCLGEISGSALITADHGNSEQMIQYDTGEPHTFHTTFPVPIALYQTETSAGVKLREGGALCDIAPTVCDILDIPKPEQMTGKSLIER